MNNRKYNEKTKTFNWNQTPTCKHMKKVKFSNGNVVEICSIHKGVGKRGTICAYAGIYPQCKFYESKNKWGKSLVELAGDLMWRE